MKMIKIKNNGNAVNNSNGGSADGSRNELIPIISGNNGEMLVDARELHLRLQVGRDFSTWIKSRIFQYDFIEGEDFLIPQNGGIKKQNEKGGDRKSIDYQLTMDMAKELAMLERNYIGKKFRKYFIAAEKELRNKEMRQLVDIDLPFDKIKLKPLMVEGRKMYSLIDLRREWHINTHGGTSEIRSKYPGQILRIGLRNFVSEEYVRIMQVNLTKKMVERRAFLAKAVM